MSKDKEEKLKLKEKKSEAASSISSVGSSLTPQPSPLIVALDTPSLEAAGRLIKDLSGLVSFYKVGFELFTAHGWKAVEQIKNSGAKVFLDLKLHDIPNTVAKTAAVITAHEVDMFNVHALGGLEMMRAARKSVEEYSVGRETRPLLIAVTILTSHSGEDLQKLGITRELKEQVLALAGLAKEAGLDGVVSSPEEIKLLREKFPSDFLIVTPGIRPAQSAKGDQKRTFGPKEAVAAGTSYMVVGRPITDAKDPRAATRAILESIA